MELIKRNLLYSLRIFLPTLNKKVIKVKGKVDNNLSNNQKVLCPLCKSNKSIFCYEEEGLDTDYSKKELGIYTEKYFVCKNCGLVYMYPRPKTETLKRYYKSVAVSRTSSKVMSEYKDLDYKHTIDFIIEHTPFPCFKKIVEVGAGSGYFLHIFNHYTNAKLIGIEISKKSCDYARNIYGLEMIQEQFEEVDLAKRDLNESVDLVVCSNTLEHIIEPYIFLQKLGRMVKPRGFLYIEVPSTKGFATSKKAKCGRNIHHLHLNHFLAYNLFAACEKLRLYPVIVLDDIGTNYPSLKALFIKQSPAERGKNLFLQQVALLEDMYKQAKDIIAAVLNASDKKIVLWGAGMDLFYVLRENPETLSSDRMILVDRNLHKQGKDFFGLKVQNPEGVDWNRIGFILITPSNQMLQLHIREDINRMCPNNIKCLLMFPVKNQKSYLEGTI